MKYVIALIFLLSLGHSQDLQNSQTYKLAKALRLGDAELKIENVTERESAARGIPLKSAWIVSVPDHPLFFPLIIYTSEKGMLNGSSRDEWRKLLREPRKSQDKFSEQFGVFNYSGVGDCLVILDQVRVSSNNPEGVDGVIHPWRPNGVAGVSIIGTLEQQKLDFQITLLFANEDAITDFPEYKRMLYGPDFPVMKDLAFELIEAVSDSKIIPAKVTKAQKTEQLNGEVKSGGETKVLNHYKWIWIMLIAGLVVAIFFIRAKTLPK